MAGHQLRSLNAKPANNTNANSLNLRVIVTIHLLERKRGGNAADIHRGPGYVKIPDYFVAI